jgi:hypothetical protein
MITRDCLDQFTYYAMNRYVVFRANGYWPRKDPSLTEHGMLADGPIGIHEGKNLIQRIMTACS